jgi:hypothetical protein
MERELMVLLSLIVLYTVWVLLPIVPSVLIYRLFPSTTVAVSGPLASLTVRASGAFAAYLIVFAATYTVISRAEETIGGFQHPFWTIKGQIRLVDHDGKETHSEALLAKLVLKTEPGPFTVQSYLVRMNVPEVEDFPLLILDIPSWGRNVIDLKTEPSVTFDRYHKTIELTKAITIQELAPASPAYDPRPIAASAPTGTDAVTRRNP